MLDKSVGGEHAPRTVGVRDERFYQTLGATVRRRRDALGMKQQELGALLNPPMTRASIANIEAGKQRVLAHTLVELANILKVTVDELARGADVGDAELEAELQQAAGLDAKTAKALTEKILAPKGRRRSA
jgi:transcriptional regulator with XRE-family HTH domain